MKFPDLQYNKDFTYHIGVWLSWHYFCGVLIEELVDLRPSESVPDFQVVNEQSELRRLLCVLGICLVLNTKLREQINVNTGSYNIMYNYWRWCTFTSENCWVRNCYRSLRGEARINQLFIKLHICVLRPHPWLSLNYYVHAHTLVHNWYLVQFQLDEHWVISARSPSHPPVTGGGSLTTTATPPLTTAASISTSSRTWRQSIRPCRWGGTTRQICGLSSSPIATSVRPVSICSSTRVELILCWCVIMSVWVTSGSCSVAIVTVWAMRAGGGREGGWWGRCGGLEVSSSIHVPDDCHLFKGVRYHRLWVVLGPLQLISVTILWNW